MGGKKTGKNEVWNNFNKQFIWIFIFFLEEVSFGNAEGVLQAVEPCTFFSKESRTFLLDMVVNYNFKGEGKIVQFCDLKELLSELGKECP